MAETEAPAFGESRRQQLLPRPTATAPAADSTLSARLPPERGRGGVLMGADASSCERTRSCGIRSHYDLTGAVDVRDSTWLHKLLSSAGRVGKHAACQPRKVWMGPLPGRA